MSDYHLERLASPNSTRLLTSDWIEIEIANTTANHNYRMSTRVLQRHHFWISPADFFNNSATAQTELRPMQVTAPGVPILQLLSSVTSESWRVNFDIRQWEAGDINFTAFYTGTVSSASFLTLDCIGSAWGDRQLLTAASTMVTSTAGTGVGSKSLTINMTVNNGDVQFAQWSWSLSSAGSAQENADIFSLLISLDDASSSNPYTGAINLIGIAASVDTSLAL